MVAGSVRERNVRHEPRLTMTITEGGRDAHVVVLIEGPADVLSSADVPADIRAAVGRDAGPGCWAGMLGRDAGPGRRSCHRCDLPTGITRYIVFS
jgi:hypothetical protein